MSPRPIKELQLSVSERKRIREELTRIFDKNHRILSDLERIRYIQKRNIIKLFMYEIGFQNYESKKLDLQSIKLRLCKFTDWVPFKSIRKKQKKLIADEITEICFIMERGDISLVRWRCFWLYVHWLRYLLMGPVDSLIKVIRKKSVS